MSIRLEQQNQEEEQQQEFVTTIEVIVKGPKRITMVYEKRAAVIGNGKEFGSMNDFQMYENVSSEFISNFINTKKIQKNGIKWIKEVKNMVVFLNKVSQIKAGLK